MSLHAAFNFQIKSRIFMISADTHRWYASFSSESKWWTTPHVMRWVEIVFFFISYFLLRIFKPRFKHEMEEKKWKKNWILYTTVVLIRGQWIKNYTNETYILNVILSFEISVSLFKTPIIVTAILKAESILLGLSTSVRRYMTQQSYVEWFCTAAEHYVYDITCCGWDERVNTETFGDEIVANMTSVLPVSPGRSAEDFFVWYAICRFFEIFPANVLQQPPTLRVFRSDWIVSFFLTCDLPGLRSPSGCKGVWISEFQACVICE